MQSDFSIASIGDPSGWGYPGFVHPPTGLTLLKRFLKQEIGSDAIELSANTMRPGDALPFRHRHELNEEVYVFLDGVGEFEADGQIIPIAPGTVVRCAPGVARSWRNTGDRAMPYLCIQARAGSYVGTGTLTDGRPADGAPVWVDAR
jgi:mannose-6-phosphate isomerase-like protein (cupin superfamily)